MLPPEHVQLKSNWLTQPSFFKLLGEADRTKVTWMKCPLGRIPDSFHRDDGGDPFDWRRTIGATTRKHSLVFTVKTLHSSVIFLQRPSLFTSRLRSRRGGFNTRRWQRRRRATGVFIKPVWMIQGDGVWRLLRGKQRLQPNIYLFRRERNCFH